MRVPTSSARGALIVRFFLWWGSQKRAMAPGAAAAGPPKKKIKNLEIRKANFEVFVFTSSLAAETCRPGTARNAQRCKSGCNLPRDPPDAQPQQGAVVPLRLNWF